MISFAVNTIAVNRAYFRFLAVTVMEKASTSIVNAPLRQLVQTPTKFNMGGFVYTRPVIFSSSPITLSPFVLSPCTLSPPLIHIQI